MLGERCRRGVAEDQGRCQPQPGVRGQAVAQLDSHQRVESHLLEGPLGRDRGRVGVAEHGGDVAAHKFQQCLVTRDVVQGGQSLPQRGLRRCW